MQLFPQDNVTVYDTGFEDDIFGRKEISKQLSDLVQRIESPLVIALDDDWGTGKSYFLKRWVGAHSKENDGESITVYFDAFAHDYLSDPLVSLVTAFEERIPQDKKADIATRIKTVGAKLAKPAFGIGLSLLTFGAQKHLEAFGDALAEAVSDEAQNAIDQLWAEEASRQKAVQEFKNALSDLVKQEDTSPVVIVVDELDRCRPDYALSVLEVIKHFFAVPKVHFVLGVNGAALQNSVKARYGSGIDAEAYLRKFINISFSLPRLLGRGKHENVAVKYAQKILSDPSMTSNFKSLLIDWVGYVEQARGLSLRDVERISAKVALLPNQALGGNSLRGFQEILAFFLVVHLVRPDLYQRCIRRMATIDEIRDFIGATDERIKRPSDGTSNQFYDVGIVHRLALISYSCCQKPWFADELGDVAEFYRNNFGWSDQSEVLRVVKSEWMHVFTLNLK